MADSKHASLDSIFHSKVGDLSAFVEMLRVLASVNDEGRTLTVRMQNYIDSHLCDAVRAGFVDMTLNSWTVPFVLVDLNMSAVFFWASCSKCFPGSHEAIGFLRSG